MKHNYSAKIVLAISLALIVIITGCSGNGSDNSTIVSASGKAGSGNLRALSASSEFLSGELIVEGENITDRLVKSPDQTTASGSGSDTLYEATIDNVPQTIVIKAKPLPGFVFSEWRLNTRRAMNDGYGWRGLFDLMLSPSERFAETLTVEADKAKYYIASFERGAYIDLDRTEMGGDGTKEKPFSNFDEAIKEIPVLPHWIDDDDEITFKVAGNLDGTQSVSLNIQQMASVYGGRSEEIEEIRVLGGYDSSWKKAGRSVIALEYAGFMRNSELEEIEFSSVHIPELNYSALWTDEMEPDDIEFYDVSVGSIINPSRYIANLVIENTEGLEGKTFINCVVDRALENATYIHTLIKEASGTVNGFNNIILSDTVDAGITDRNYYLPTNTPIAGYMLENPPSDITEAHVYSEDYFEDYLPSGEDIAEVLETDIAGRERNYDDDVSPQMRKSSYGPYEYLDVERWDDDWRDDWFDDWDDRWDD